MKTIVSTVFLGLAALMLGACGAPATNSNTNTNTNTAKPSAAAPTADALLALDKQANEAFLKGDGKFFEGFLSDKFVMSEAGQRLNKAAVVDMISKTKCESKSFELTEPQMAKIDADTYVLSYKGTFDGTCAGPDGKSMKIPSPVRAATVWVRAGEKWHAAFHGETLIVDPKNPPAQPAKPEAKKEEPKKDDKAAANSAATSDAPAKPTPSANTDALVKLHTAGWEAWKAKDAKKLGEQSAANLSFLSPMGGWFGTKAETIKYWTEGMKCEGVTKVSVTDGFASALSPTVEILTHKGTADGTCDGQKNGTLHGTAVYVKEGDAWKLAFLFESPA